MRQSPLRARRVVPGTTLAHAVWDVGGVFIRERIHQDEYDLFISGKHPLNKLPEPDRLANWLIGSGGAPRLDTTNGDSVFGDIWECMGKICIRTGDDGDYGYKTANEIGIGFQVESCGNFLFLDLADFIGVFPVLTLKKQLHGITIINGWLRVEDVAVKRPTKEDFDFSFAVHHSIAFDAATSGTAAGPTTSLSFSHTDGSGSNRAILGAITWDTNSATAAATYNSVSLTGQWSIASGAIFLAGLALVAPATGANTLAFTVGSSFRNTGVAVTLTGVDQTTPTRTSATATGTFSPATVDVTTVTDDMVVDFGYLLSSSAPTAGAGQTERISLDVSSNRHVSSTETATGTTTTSSWTGSFSNWFIGTTPFIPAGAGGRTTKNTRVSPLGIEIGMGWRMDL